MICTLGDYFTNEGVIYKCGEAKSSFQPCRWLAPYGFCKLLGVRVNRIKNLSGIEELTEASEELPE